MNIFANRAPALHDPARDIVPVTPSDSTDLPMVAVAMYIETGGAVSFVTVTGQTRTVTVPDATLLPVGVVRVQATGTSATGIHALTVA